MNRRAFLKLLPMAIITPFVGRLKSQETVRPNSAVYLPIIQKQAEVDSLEELIIMGVSVFGSWQFPLVFNEDNI